MLSRTPRARVVGRGTLVGWQSLHKARGALQARWKHQTSCLCPRPRCPFLKVRGEERAPLPRATQAPSLQALLSCHCFCIFVLGSSFPQQRTCSGIGFLRWDTLGTNSARAARSQLRSDLHTPCILGQFWSESSRALHGCRI